MKNIVQWYFITIMSEEQIDLLNLLQPPSVLYNLEKKSEEDKEIVLYSVSLSWFFICISTQNLIMFLKTYSDIWAICKLFPEIIIWDFS